MKASGIPLQFIKDGGRRRREKYLLTSLREGKFHIVYMEESIHPGMLHNMYFPFLKFGPKTILCRVFFKKSRKGLEYGRFLSMYGNTNWEQDMGTLTVAY